MSEQPWPGAYSTLVSLQGAITELQRTARSTAEAIVIKRVQWLFSDYTDAGAVPKEVMFERSEYRCVQQALQSRDDAACLEYMSKLAEDEWRSQLLIFDRKIKPPWQLSYDEVRGVEFTSVS